MYESGQIKGLFSSINISATGLSGQRTKMNTIADNIANADTTRTEDGGPYRKKQVIFSEKAKGQFQSRLETEHMKLETTKLRHLPNDTSNEVRESFAQGVEVIDIHQDDRPPRLIYDPDHPDADENGFVAYPNINVVTEMVNMIAASRAYEANVTAMNASKTMMQQALEI